MVGSNFSISIVGESKPQCDALFGRLSSGGEVKMPMLPECCGIRKVEPLRRALAGVPAYVTGQRRDQSPDTRNAVPMVQLDDAFAEPGSTLVKFNPLAGWSSAQVWRYIREHDVPPAHEGLTQQPENPPIGADEAFGGSEPSTASTSANPDDDIPF